MKADAAEIQDYADCGGLATPWAKSQQLSERVQNFVDNWRVQMPEAQLSESEKALYFSLVGAVFNCLPSYSELSTHFLTQAIRYDQKSSFAYLQLGIASTKSRNYRRAALMLELAHRFAKPENLSELFSHQSQLYRLLPPAQHPEAPGLALQTAREAVDSNPNDERSWFALGMSLLRALRATNENELAKAGHALRKAIMIRETKQKPYPDARFNYGMLLKLRLDFQGAYEQFRRAHEEDSSLQQAVQRATEIEQLVSAAAGKMQGRAPDLLVFADSTKGLAGLALGRNQFKLAFRLLAKLNEGVPTFLLVQNADGQKTVRAVFATSRQVKELEPGAVVELSEFVVRQIGLKTKGAHYQLVVVTQDEGEMTVNGQQVAAGELVWGSEVK